MIKNEYFFFWNESPLIINFVYNIGDDGRRDLPQLDEYIGSNSAKRDEGKILAKKLSILKNALINERQLHQKNL